ncbi:MAG: hypothetical protein LQ343_000864 [Gyalolechia ehrenbergii]|nr:MAG: hypothetical protein LQ343_000864 [Gyalolechia ehrenbergii]
MDPGGQQGSKAIPRFASFRSEVLPTPSPEPTEGTDANGPRSSNHHRNSVRKHRRHANKRPSPSIASGHGSDPLLESKQQYERLENSPTTFTLDVKGDFRNLHYGSNYGVPSYPRAPTRVALGSKSSVASIAHRTTSADQGKRTISKQIIPELRRQTSKRVKAGSNSDQDDGRPDFIPLQRPKLVKRNQKRWTNGHTSFRNMGSPTHWLIDGESQSTPNSDEDTENFTDESGSERESPGVSVLDEHLQWKRAALSSKVEQDPANWQSWVELVELQDEMDGFLLDSSQVRLSNAERQSNAEIVLSICNKALRSVVDPEGRERLYLCQMSKVPQVWERGKVLSRWQPILQEHPSSHRLWTKFLDFNQSTFSGFSLEETRKQYLGCLDMLQAARERSHSEPAQQSEIFSSQVYILLRLTLMLREAGYAEMGVAMWQALLEYQFNKLQQTRHTSQQAAAKSTYHESTLAFQQFWNSETPRIGEPNAKGWLKFNENDFEYEQLSEIAEVLSQAEGITLRSWSETEREVASTSRTPRRSIDKSSDDPFRVAFFWDVRSALIESPTPSDTTTMLSAFLCFCHLPPYLDSSNLHIKPWYSDQFVRNEVLYDQSMSAAFSQRGSGSMSPNLANFEDSVPDANVSNSSSAAPFVFPLTEHQISSDTLFSTSRGWFSAFGAGFQSAWPIPKEFALQTLKFLVDHGIGGDDLAEYLLALELQVSPATVKKSAKSLLKTRPSSLRLYNAYALVQGQLGKREEAKTVIETAIRMSTTLDDSARRDVILLWRSRMWQHLSDGETSIALGLLLRFEPGSDSEGRTNDEDKTLDATSATPRLRLRKALSAGRDHMLSLGFATHAVCYAELLVVLEYLQDATSLQAAQGSFRANLDILTKYTLSNRTSEALFRQSFARLLYTHIIHKRPFSPATIRSFLTESITAFPQNTIFLSLYAWNESRFRIDDRVRGIMRDVVFGHRHHHRPASDDAASNSIIPHFFAVHTDLHRGIAHGSNQNAIRGSFERTIRSEDAAHSASLWKLYFLFEYENGEMKRTRDLFYRAVRACPWVKEVYMLAFDYLAEVMSEEELRGVYEMMLEKELRIHVAL